uniref:Uncharacterized protein n=1 Tax=Coccidioides posadasii RMSCC 3488 TaxID=454284 RepID=A0A0J6FCR9_COCPO|nr:hypothetical protein CPAG_03406 [Coccidioides posadasii RMSCC 3488]
MGGYVSRLGRQFIRPPPLHLVVALAKRVNLRGLKKGGSSVHLKTYDATTVSSKLQPQEQSLKKPRDTAAPPELSSAPWRCPRWLELIQKISMFWTKCSEGMSLLADTRLSLLRSTPLDSRPRWTVRAGVRLPGGGDTVDAALPGAA